MGAQLRERDRAIEVRFDVVTCALNQFHLLFKRRGLARATALASTETRLFSSR